jgi:hypothetical protein
LFSFIDWLIIIIKITIKIIIIKIVIKIIIRIKISIIIRIIITLRRISTKILIRKTGIRIISIIAIKRR